MSIAKELFWVLKWKTICSTPQEGLESVPMVESNLKLNFNWCSFGNICQMGTEGLLLDHTGVIISSFSMSD